LAVRMFHEEADITVHVLLDCSASMAVPAAARLVFAKRLAAAVAYIALANLDRVSVQTFSTGLGAALAPTRGKARVFKVFRFLAARTPEAGTYFANAARAFVARTKRSGPAVVITDGYDPEGIERGVDTLRHHGFDPFVIELVDPDEAKDDWAGDLELVDAETGDVRVVTMTRDTLDGYRSRRAARSAALARALREKQVRHLALNIHTPLPDAIMELLRHGGLFA
ncbi:MAG: DUF58 domain-containing protein, partial [Myxococcales bacterium]|nr:DUF58 domain-containing protein [Myxococcales bacterium]